MPTVPSVRRAADPSAHEAHLVAFAGQGSGYVVLERVVDSAPRVALYEIDADEGTRRPIPGAGDELIRALTVAWPAGETLGVELRKSRLGARLAERGYVWPTRLQAHEIETPHGTVALEDDLTVVLRDATDRVVVARLAPEPEPDAYAWLASPGRERIALTARYEGTPRVVDLRVIDLRKGEARLLAKRGFAAYRDRDYREAASTWREALSLDPEAADVLYNLACAMALQGEPERALGPLQAAIEHGGGRYREIARKDTDLESLWENEQFARIVERPGLPAPD
jgi:tetratricopeptide (TPR) repeat protein